MERSAIIWFLPLRLAGRALLGRWPWGLASDRRKRPEHCLLNAGAVFAAPMGQSGALHDEARAHQLVSLFAFFCVHVR